MQCYVSALCYCHVVICVAFTAVDCKMEMGYNEKMFVIPLFAVTFYGRGMAMDLQDAEIMGKVR